MPDPTCRKRGPYLPVGDVDWVCLTHDVDLIRVDGGWGTSPRKQDMLCPVGEQNEIGRRLG